MSKKPPKVKTPAWLDSIKEFSKSRQTTFGHDRRLTVGASEVGRCIRAVAADKSQAWKPDPDYEDTNGYAMRGNVMEDAWTAPLMRFHVERAGGKLLYSGQENQITLKADKIPLSVTPDGHAIELPRDFLAEWGVKDMGADNCVLEFKSLDDRFDKDKLPKFEHVAQTIAQVGMIRRGTKHKPKWGAVVYVDASDYFDAPWHPIEYTDEKFNALLSRARRALTVKDPNQLPPEGKMSGGRECRTCKYAQQCLGFAPWIQKGAKKLDASSAKTLAKLGKEYKALETTVARTKETLANKEAEVYAALAKAKTNFAQTGKLTIIAKQTKSQNRINQAALVAAAKAKGIDVDKFREPTKPGASLEIN